MFDETSGTWIKIYKVVTIVLFWLFMVGAVIAGIMSIANARYDSDVIYGIITAIGIALVGFIQLVTNMLVVQFLNNVQTIRETLESDD